MAKRLKNRAYARIVICLLLVGMLSGIGLSNIPIVNASPGAVIYAGCRESTYGISPFPEPQEWEQDMKIMASYWPGSQPVGIWIVGILAGEGSDYMVWTECNLQFPSPGGSYEHVIFDNTDLHEPYLDYFDTHGIKVWLQVEPGLADVPTLIDLVLDHYGSHSCVVGFGIDVEWHKQTVHDWGIPVTDENAQAWEARVKSHNSNYTLFLKHFWYTWMPPTYRGNIIFVDDSQGFGNLSKMVSEFDGWATRFYPNVVFFQYGYEADKKWWGRLANPPKDIGDAIKAVVEQDMGNIWVDFTLRMVFPPPGGDNTPPVISNVASSSITGNSATITWTTDELSDSLVRYGTTTPPGSTKSNATMVTSHSITLTNLSPTTTYYYEVQSTDASSNTAVDDNNGSYYKFTTTEADTTPPAAPTGLTATAISYSQIDLDWNNNNEPDLSHYHVYRSTTSGFTPGPGNFVSDATVSNYSNTGLDDNTTYYYKVTAVDTSSNESGPSNEASAKTPEAPTVLTMHVLRIDMELLIVGGGSYQGKATVYIVDENDDPVPSASVEGHWEGIAPTGSINSSTDSSGAARFWSPKVKNPPSGSLFIFVVTNVTKTGWTYDPNANVETRDNVMVP